MTMTAAPRSPDPGAGKSAGNATAFALHLPDEAATARVGRALAPALAPGDWVALQGPLGAGKSALARAVLRARLGDPEAEIPSPSYTLVNVYETGGQEFWHADLYRLAGIDDLQELGLADAADRGAIVLLEWPERLGGDAPERALTLTLAMAADGGRGLTIATAGGGWNAALAALGALA